MDFLKLLFENIKNSTVVANISKTMKPTEDWILKKGGLNILLMALPLIIINTLLPGVIASISLRLGGFAGMFISLILNIILFMFISMGTIVATLEAFNRFVNRGEIMVFKEYLYVAKTRALDFTMKFLRHVSLYFIIIVILGVFINKIPYLRGRAVANFINTFLIYGLTFRVYAITLGMDGDEQTIKNINNWLTFAVVAYLLNIVTSFLLLDTVIKYTFIMFTVLCLNDMNNCTNLNSADDFNDGFTNAVTDDDVYNKSSDFFDENDGFNTTFEF